MAAQQTQEAQKSTKPTTPVHQPEGQAQGLAPLTEPLDILLQRAELEPQSLTPADATRLQRSIGNQAISKLGNGNETAAPGNGRSPAPALHTILTRHTVQAKLTLGPVDDPYEREADQVAQQVVQRLHTPPADDGDDGQVQAKRVQRQEEEEEIQAKHVQRQEEEDQSVQMQTQGVVAPTGGAITSDVESNIDSARGGGQPLDKPVRSSMETAFGTDFSGVRVHTNSNADTLNQSLSARAFTTGSDIFFRQGEYNPSSSAGKELLAHELTHVVQQGASKQVPAQRQEEEEEVQAKRVQRQEEEEPLQAKRVQRQEEEKEIQTKRIQRQEEEEPLQAKRVQRHEEEEVQAKRIQRQEEEEPLQAKRIQRHEEEEVQAKRIQRQEEEEPLQAKRIQRHEEEEVQAKRVQRQEEEAAAEDDTPTPEQKAAALAKAAAALAEANAAKAAAKAAKARSQEQGQNEQAAGETPKKEAAQSVAAGKITDAKLKTQEQTQKQGKEAGLVKKAANKVAAQETTQLVTTVTPGVAGPGTGGKSSQGGGASSPTGAGAAPPTGVNGGMAPTGADLAGATTVAQAAVQQAFDFAKNPTDKAPTSPGQDPGYQQTTSKTQTIGKTEQLHADAQGEASEAQMAAESPAAEIEGKAQTTQVGEMEGAETPEFDAAAFKKALMARIAELAPKSTKEADEFKENDAVGGLKGEVQGTVAQEQTSSQQPLDSAREAAPDTGSVEPKPTEPLTNTDPGAAPLQPGAETAVPKPKGQGELEAPLQTGSQAIDQQMTDAGVTEEQLANANEPEFSAALEAKEGAQQSANTAPDAYRQEESATLSSAEQEAVTTAQTTLAGMHSDRTNLLAQSDEQQTQTKTEDEQKRAEVAAHINGIYAETQTEVEGILGGLDTEVSTIFDAGAEEAKTAFENYIDARMDAYKEERYGGFWGWAKWAKDQLLGMPSEVNVFYTEGRQLYIDKMDAVIDHIAATISTTLAQAKAAVAKGKQRIQEYVDTLPEDLQSVGQEAAQAIQGKFDELEQQIKDKQGELIDTLAQKYQENLQAIDARIEEMKAANRGLVDKAIDAIGGVLQTILELKNMLLNVLARVADAVSKIISDPIGFLGNLIGAIRQGFGQFVDNIGTHLQKGLIGWLTGSIAEAGITLPESFDLKGIFQLVLQILGVSIEQIMGKVSKVLGFDVMGLYDKVMEIVQIYQEGGLAGLAKYGLTQIIGEEGVAALMEVIHIFDVIKTGDLGQLWEIIQQHLSSLKEMVMGKIEEFIAERVIKAGITWLISLFNPAGAFIKACKMIYDVVMFFVERGSQIMSLVNAIVDSIAAIASGNIGAAANFIEQSLAKAIPVAISFLSSLLGLGNITEKVKEIIESVRTAVDNAIDKVLNSKPVQMVAGFIKKAIAKVKAFVQAGVDKVKGALGLGDPEAEQGDGKTGDGEVGETVPFSAAGESHRLWYNVQGTQATLMVASETSPVEAKISAWERSLSENPDLYGDKKPQALSLIASAKNLLGIATTEGNEAAKEKQEADQDTADTTQEEQFETADLEAEKAEESLADVLMQLFVIFGEEPPVLKGDAKVKFDQVMADAHIPNGIRNQYKDAVFTQLMQADASADQYGILKSVAAGGDYFAKGPDIPANELKAKGGMTRTIPLSTIWADNLAPAYKAQFSDFKEWLETLGGDVSAFNPNTHLDGGSTVPGRYATAWWAPRGEQKGNTMAELIEELALNPATYEGGCVRVTVSPEASRMAGFKKPTALDGIFFMEFAPAPSSPWGITGGGSLEAVAPQIAMSDVTQKEFLPSNLPQGGTGELPEGFVENAIIGYQSETATINFYRGTIQKIDTQKKQAVIQFTYTHLGQKTFSFAEIKQLVERNKIQVGGTTSKTADDLFAEASTEVQTRTQEALNQAEGSANGDWVAVFATTGRQVYVPDRKNNIRPATIGDLLTQMGVSAALLTRYIRDAINMTVALPEEHRLQPEVHEAEVNRVAGQTVEYIFSSERQAFLITPTSIPRNLTVGTGKYIRKNGDVTMSSSLYEATVRQAEDDVRKAFGDEVHHIIPLALGGSHHLLNLLSVQGKRSEDVTESAHSGLHSVLDTAGNTIEMYLRNATGDPIPVELNSMNEADLRRAIQAASKMNVIIGTLFNNGAINYQETEIVFEK